MDDETQGFKDDDCNKREFEGSEAREPTTGHPLYITKFFDQNS